MTRLIALSALLAMPPLFAADTDIALCVLCHGTDVNGNYAVRAPKLAGLPRWYLVRQLDAFRSGDRGEHPQDVGGSEMRTIALAMSAGDIAKAADFIVSRPAEPPAATVQGDATRGRELYAACAACHGARGEGNADLLAPPLARHNDWYLAMQLNNFRNGLRGTRPGDIPGAQMRVAAQSLPDQQALLDVTAYINSFSARPGAQ